MPTSLRSGRILPILAGASMLASCKHAQLPAKAPTLEAMFHTWSPIACADSRGIAQPCLIDPLDSAVGHHLKIVDFRASGLCSLEVMPFFVFKSGDTVASASDGGFWKAAGRYTLSGDTIRVVGRIYRTAYLGKVDSTWVQTFLRTGDTLRSDQDPQSYLRKPGYLHRILTGVKTESYLGHYDR